MWDAALLVIIALQLRGWKRVKKRREDEKKRQLHTPCALLKLLRFLLRHRSMQMVVMRTSPTAQKRDLIFFFSTDSGRADPCFLIKFFSCHIKVSSFTFKNAMEVVMKIRQYGNFALIVLFGYSSVLGD